ncbi:MAG: hypothetical protein NTV84_06620 [Methanoregula sp.]|nr:hypothetical protein [Methanoregula sp.]
MTDKTFDKSLEDEQPVQPEVKRCPVTGEACCCKCEQEAERMTAATIEEHPLLKKFFAAEEEIYVSKPPIEPENLKTGYLIFAGEREDVREIVSRFKSYLVYGWNVQVIDGSELL